MKAEQPVCVFLLPVSYFLPRLPFPFPPVLSASSDHSNPICRCGCSADCVLNFYQRQIVSEQVFMSKNRAIHSVTSNGIKENDISMAFLKGRAF